MWYSVYAKRVSSVSSARQTVVTNAIHATQITQRIRERFCCIVKSLIVRSKRAPSAAEGFRIALRTSLVLMGVTLASILPSAANQPGAGGNFIQKQKAAQKPKAAPKQNAAPTSPPQQPAANAPKSYVETLPDSVVKVN